MMGAFTEECNGSFKNGGKINCYGTHPSSVGIDIRFLEGADFPLHHSVLYLLCATAGTS